MCISLSKADFSKTKIYAGESVKNGKYVHVLAYQNLAFSAGPNAMILPLPAQELNSDNMIDTTEFKDFLNSIVDATRLKLLSDTKSAKRLDSRSFKVFDKGSYTVVLADKPSQVIEGIKQVPENKRPNLNLAVLNSFSINYPGWKLAICCWSGNIQPEPLLWWYDPMESESNFYGAKIFAPGLDSHDGTPPRNQGVMTDHFVTFGSTIDLLGEDVEYPNTIPLEIRKILPQRAIGTYFNKKITNGDFWFTRSNFLKDIRICERISPISVKQDLPIVPVE